MSMPGTLHGPHWCAGPCSHGLEFTAITPLARRSMAPRRQETSARSMARIIPSISYNRQARIRAFGSRPAPAVRGQRRMDALGEVVSPTMAANDHDGGVHIVTCHRRGTRYHRRPTTAGWRREWRRSLRCATKRRAGWLARNSSTAPGFHNVDFRIGTAVRARRTGEASLIGEAFKPVQPHHVSGVSNTAFSYAAAGSGLCAGHANACLRSLHFHPYWRPPPPAT